MTAEIDKEYDRDIACACPYCELLRYGKLISEPSERERMNALMRLAQRAEPMDLDALERARKWDACPEHIKRDIKEGEDYKQLRRIAQMRREQRLSEQPKHTRNPPPSGSDLPPFLQTLLGGLGLEEVPMRQPGVRMFRGGVNAPEGAYNGPLKGLLTEQQQKHYDSFREVFNARVGRFQYEAPKPEQPAFMGAVRLEPVPTAPKPEPLSAEEAYAEQMTSAIAKLGELLKDDEEMCEQERELAILRLAEIRLLWEHR